MKDDVSDNSFLSRYWLQFTLAAVAVSRLPLLGNGYGSDPDAWRVAYVGQIIWTTGSYEMSRPPGYPLHEFISAPLAASGGSLLSNAAAIFAMLILVTVFARWAAIATQHPRLVTIAVAFLPLLWINSATTLDYTWSLLFIILSLSSLDKGSGMGGGLLAGIAAGFRLSNIVVVIPFCIMIWMKHRSPKRLIRFLAGSMIGTTAAFVPVIATYGFAEWLHFAQTQLVRVKLPFSDQLLFFGYRTVYAVGLVAFAAVVWILLASRKKIRQLIQEHDILFIVCTSAVILFVLQFFFLPLDRSYLLPALFFLLVGIERVASKMHLTVLVLCVVSFAFANIDVIRHSGPERGTFHPAFNHGLVLEEVAKREKQLRNRLAIASLSFEEKAIIMTGTDASFWFENPLVERDTSDIWNTFKNPVFRNKRSPHIVFVPALSKTELRIAQEMNYSAYCIEEMKEYVESVVGYPFTEQGVALVSVDEME